MKKLLSLTLALALVLGLTACGGKKENYKTGDVQAMVKAGAFSEELEELDGDTAFALYKLADAGLEREDLKDCAVLRSAGATCEEAAVLVLSDNQKAESAGKALFAYIDQQIAANEDYRPAEIPKLKGAYCNTWGNTVLMVVASDMDAAKTALGEKPDVTSPAGTAAAS